MRSVMCRTISDMELDFLEFDGEFGIDGDRFSEDEGEDGHDEAAVTESKAFWVEQHRLLQDVLCRSSLAETRIRSDTEEALAGPTCSCLKGSCGRNCALRCVADRLRDARYNSAVCRSKWARSPDIPSGEHSFVDVVVEGKNVKKCPIRVVIEPNFRSEFEMARANEEYNGLVARLPEVFVGKSERLRSVIKIMCCAAKKCAKENKMHLAPWRKHKYVQSKWLGTCERTLTPGLPMTVKVPGQERPPRPRASMLTFDLHCTAVEVVYVVRDEEYI